MKVIFKILLIVLLGKPEQMPELSSPFFKISLFLPSVA